MSTIDYEQVKRDDLEMVREPRKSQFTVHHKPSGAVASDPVVPGSLAPARFRRPQNMPADNRVKNMEGYVESTREEDQQFFVITAGDTAKNEYLDALAADPSALRASFEGAPKSDAGKDKDKEKDAPATPAGTPVTQPATTVAPLESAPAEPQQSPPANEATALDDPVTVGEAATPDAVVAVPAGSVPETVEVGNEDELDDLLSQLD